ncbi:MAG TPA: hypothetical protein VGW78_06175 [Candidatus Babeliales bacterium]|jgi:hypothetical protein|nr:hypothetical protein [Candidatus Babeliales bacterium]
MKNIIIGITFASTIIIGMEQSQYILSSSPTLCTLTEPLSSLYTSAQRYYSSWYDPDTQRRILGLEHDATEKNKTLLGYQKVLQQFGDCTESDLDFFNKRLYLAMNYANTLCGLKNKECTSKHLQEMRTLIDIHGNVLPPIITQKIQNKAQEVTDLLQRNIIGTTGIPEYTLDFEQQKNLVSILLQADIIHKQEYETEMNNLKQEAMEKAAKDVERSMIQKYVARHIQKTSEQ